MLEFKNVPQFHKLSHQHPTVDTFLFDMDGTLFHTEAIHTKASWQAILKALPEAFSDTPEQMHQFESKILGLSDDQVLDLYQLQQTDPRAQIFLTERKKAWNSMQAQKVPVFSPEILILATEIKKHGHKIGLVTSSDKNQCYELINHSPFKHLFDLIITRDDVINPKPHPEPYHKALSQLQSSPEKTIVFEDSEVGYQSALAAKTIVYKVSWYLHT